MTTRCSLLALVSVFLVGCASSGDYFYPNTGHVTSELKKLPYADVVAYGDQAYKDGFYREASRLFMEARLLAKQQNVVDETVLAEINTKEIQSLFRKRELELQRAIERYGDTHAEVADKLFWLAGSVNGLGQTQRAIEYTQRAIDIGEIVLRPNDDDLNRYYMNMGYLLRDDGQHAEAIVFYDKATQGNIETYTPYPQARSALHYSYGLSYKEIGNRSKARQHMESAHNYCQQTADNGDFCRQIKSDLASLAK